MEKTEKHNIREIDVKDILLDAENPRFGDDRSGLQEQSNVLDRIVDKFGVDDILSSIAVNGYFHSEPLVCQKREQNKYIVKEGNRRLTACLILLRDKRASKHEVRANKYGKLWEENGQKSINPVPVIVFGADEEDNKSILSYLGVRHIASTQPWDSYAKASWVAEVVKESELGIKEIARMIGVEPNTITKQLEGYYLVNQLEKEKLFQPANSMRRGRGSQSQFPFSWVYTIVGYANVREFLRLGDATPPQEDILDKERLDNGALVLNSMFGDSSKGRDASIEESRELKRLAKVFDSEEKISLLRSGKRVDEIERVTRPIEQRINEDLNLTRDTMRALIGQLAEYGGVEKDISERDIEHMLDSAEKNETLAKRLYQRVIEFCDKQRSSIDGS